MSAALPRLDPIHSEPNQASSWPSIRKTKRQRRIAWQSWRCGRSNRRRPARLDGRTLTSDSCRFRRSFLRVTSEADRATDQVEP